jgi:hypothetical protein
MNSPDQFIGGSFAWFTGVVEDIKDPFEMGLWNYWKYLRRVALNLYFVDSLVSPCTILHS